MTNTSSNTVSVIEPNKNTVIATIEVGIGPTGITFDGNNIYVANYFSDTVVKLLPR